MSRYSGKEYVSGFERLSIAYPETLERYSVAIMAIKERFSGFNVKDGFNSKCPDKLTQAQRLQVRRYYNALTQYREGGFTYEMRPSELPAKIKKGGPKNIEAVMRAAGMHTGRKRAKVIFVKFDGENIPRIGVRAGSPVFIDKHTGYTREVIELNKKALALDPRGTVLSIKEHTKGALMYRVGNISGNDHYDTKNAVAAASDLPKLAEEIIRLQNEYKNWGSWLTGAVAYYSDSISGGAIRIHLQKTKERYSLERQKIAAERRKLNKQS
jgi:hypothetical protein